MFRSLYVYTGNVVYADPVHSTATTVSMAIELSFQVLDQIDVLVATIAECLRSQEFYIKFSKIVFYISLQFPNVHHQVLFEHILL